MSNAHSANGTIRQQKTKNSQKQPRRFRMQFKFWLDMSKPNEETIADVIEEMKSNRTYSQVIRDGIQLVHSLRAGRVDVLEALFPWIADYYRSKQASPADEFLQIIRQQADILARMPGSNPVSNPVSFNYDDLPDDINIFAEVASEPAVTAAEARATFTGSMGNLFDDDDDDLFDD